MENYLNTASIDYVHSGKVEKVLKSTFLSQILKVHFYRSLAMCFTVLYLACSHLSDFHHNYIQNKYSNQALIPLCIISVDDLLSDLEDKLDTSDYHPNSRFNYPYENKKRIRYIIDEISSNILSTFIGLKYKVYWFK